MKITSEQHPEYKIEEAVIRNHEKLGYGLIYPPIRRVLFYRGSGFVDLVLLPKENKHRLVLVEAKHSTNAESGEKVIGQLLKYYAYALSLGENSLSLLANFAENNIKVAYGTTKITPQKLCGGLHRDEAMPQMIEGKRLQSEEIGLFVAIDGKVEASLSLIVSTLREQHNLSIGIIQVSDDTILIH